MTDEPTFGAFRVTETIGAGALSTIHRAIQEPLGRVVAIKALKSQISPGSSFAEQLEREAKILGELAHPNVVLLIDHGRSATGGPYLVLEHVDGPSLQKVLKKKRALSVEQALAVALGVASALEHAHERCVVHRDVKPSNVLLSQAGVVKLIDFGIAQRARTASISDAFATEAITASGRMAPEPLKDAFGTPAYMSPEQILGDFVDGRSDLFSLGVVLYEMLSGSRPFEAPGGDDAKPQRLRRDVPTPLRDRAPGVPRAVERIAMRLLEKSPQERYASATDARERIGAALRALTRQDPPAIVRGALAETGFGAHVRKSDGSGVEVSEGSASMKRVLAGYGGILVAFVSAVALFEGRAWSSRDGARAGAQPLALSPDDAGGLRVLATPWAHVRVDGEEIETTPFARAIPLAAGKHFVTLVHPDAPPVEREITVVARETVTLDVTLDVPEGDAGRDAR